MINLLFSGEIPLFFMLVIALVISLTFHEFGHALFAKIYGDDTAERMGRLTLNPIAHIDPMGLLMVVFVGFGYAKPVPTDPRKFNSRWADLMISSAGPGMNLVLAFVAINGYGLAREAGFDIPVGSGPWLFIHYLVRINLILMIFNLIPIGPLDGHYIMPYFLSREMGQKYLAFNEQYGTNILMGLVLLSFVGVPVFSVLMNVGRVIQPFITIF